MTGTEKSRAALLDDLQQAQQRIARLEAEAALRALNDRLPRLIDALPYAVTVTDLRGQLLFANVPCAHLLGYVTVGDLLASGNEVLDFVAPDDRVRARHYHRVTLERGPLDSAEFTLVRSDGSRFAAEVSANPVLDDSAQPTAVLQVWRDITSRKAKDMVSKANEERLRIISDMTTDYAYSFRWNPVGRFEVEWITGAFERITGYTPAEMVAQGWESIRHPDDAAVGRQRIANLLAGKVSVMESRVICKDGTVRWLRDYSQPVMDAAGQLIRMVGAATDITAQKLAHVALGESEQRYRTLVEAFPDVVIVSDYEGRALYANPALERHTGLTLDDFQQGREHNPYFYPEDAERVRQAYQDFLQSDAEVSGPIENRMIDKAGNVLWVSGVLTKIQYQGQPALQTISRNITAQKAAEKERLALVEERERSETLRTLIGSILHDIKAPLAVIGSSLYLVENHPNPEGRQKHIRVIGEQIETLNLFVQDLLALSRLESGTALRLAPLDVRRLLQAIADEFEPLLTARQVTLTFDAQEGLPYVAAEHMLLRRAFTNLIENALHYTPEDGAVQVRVVCTAQTLVIDVLDTGIGIAAHDLPHIFERFFRSREAEQVRPDGSGLGLAIVRRVIERHAGRIEVESVQGQGSMFRVLLPAL